MSTEDKGFPGAVYPSQKIAELSADNARLRGELAALRAAQPDPAMVVALARTVQILWRMQSDHAISVMKETGLVQQVAGTLRLTPLGRAALAAAGEE